MPTNPAAKRAGALEVGTTGGGEVVIVHPSLLTDANGVGHIIFSPEQAYSLALSLCRQACAAEAEVERRAIQASIVGTVRGTVDGQPTSSLNYLQRLRELVDIETQWLAQKADRKARR